MYLVCATELDLGIFIPLSVTWTTVGEAYVCISSSGLIGDDDDSAYSNEQLDVFVNVIKIPFT